MNISRRFFQAFLRDERGLATADWVVLSAALIIGTVAFTQVVGSGASKVATAYQSPLAPITFTASSPE